MSKKAEIEVGLQVT